MTEYSVGPKSKRASLKRVTGFNDSFLQTMSEPGPTEVREKVWEWFPPHPRRKSSRYRIQYFKIRERKKSRWKTWRILWAPANVPVGLVIESHRESSDLKVKELERLHFGSKWLSDFDETVSCHKISSILRMWNCREASFWDDPFVWSFRPPGLMQGFVFHYFRICFFFKQPVADDF